ncbi:MAG: YfiR family protein [Candidatus Poribacteria bacterium]|nr:YfiR family protein [Candidatus Poribacteria bacterium]
MAFAQQMIAPVRVQYAVLKKVLTFDRALPLRLVESEEIVVGIVYQARFRESLNARDEFIRVSKEDKDRKLFDKPYRIESIDVEDVSDWKKKLLESKPNILYIAPLRAVELTTITKITRDAGIVTLTGVPQYVEQGISVGVGLKGGNKPEILVNVTAAKAEGADFHSELLKLSRIYR